MTDIGKLSFDGLVETMKAVAEPTRLRLVSLLSRSDLTVSDLTMILGQSQPRISRHLKLLVEAGVLSRYQEGAWAYFRLADAAAGTGLVAALVGRVEPSDPVLQRDAERLDAVRAERARRAADYFSRNADGWDRIRSLHASDADVEAALLSALGETRVETLLDVGTGTGRILEVLAPHCGRAIGIDASREMLTIARAKLEEAGLFNAQVRQGEAYRLPVERETFDLVTLHQVLHYLDDPQAAVTEAARAIAPGGRLAIIDFAPHTLEFLRTDHAHLRLGFSDAALSGFVEAAGLEVTSIDHLSASGSAVGDLTVAILVARDRRVLMADLEPIQTQELGAAA